MYATSYDIDFQIMIYKQSAMHGCIIYTEIPAIILAIDEEMCLVGSTVDILYIQRIMTDLEKIHNDLSSKSNILSQLHRILLQASALPGVVHSQKF